MRALLFGALLLLGACTLQVPINLPGSLQQQPAADVSLPINTGSTPAISSAVCPGKVEYTAAQNAAIDKAMGTLPPDSVIFSFLADYHNMRTADDLCLHPKP